MPTCSNSSSFFIIIRFAGHRCSQLANKFRHLTFFIHVVCWVDNRFQITADWQCHEWRAEFLLYLYDSPINGVIITIPFHSWTHNGCKCNITGVGLINNVQLRETEGNFVKLISLSKSRMECHEKCFPYDDLNILNWVYGPSNLRSVWLKYVGSDIFFVEEE